jgi:hypothetical protein
VPAELPFLPNLAPLDHVPVRREELDAAFPPPAKTLGLKGIHVIGLIIEAMGRPMTIAEVHGHVQRWGLEFDEPALRRCAERPDAFLRRVDDDRWTVDSENGRMLAARRRVRQLILLNAEKRERERRSAAATERFRAREAAKAEALDHREQKVEWRGRLLSVQPRILLTRSFDQRDHKYLGYMLRIRGALDDREAEFTVGIGPAAQQRHSFRVGDEVAGASLAVGDPRTEAVQYYKTSALSLAKRAPDLPERPPPWHGTPPDIAVYRERGSRRLDPKVYESRCASCIWGCRMPVVMIIDQWNSSRRRYRFETFCYGPKDCSFYRAGPTRKVPGRKGMSWEEEDWVDEQETSGRPRGPSD